MICARLAGQTILALIPIIHGHPFLFPGLHGYEPDTVILRKGGNDRNIRGQKILDNPAIQNLPVIRGIPV